MPKNDVGVGAIHRRPRLQPPVQARRQPASRVHDALYDPVLVARDGDGVVVADEADHLDRPLPRRGALPLSLIHI